MLNADKNLLMEKIKIGNSDYKREQMEQGVYGWGTSAREFIETTCKKNQRLFLLATQNKTVKNLKPFLLKNFQGTQKDFSNYAST